MDARSASRRSRMASRGGLKHHHGIVERRARASRDQEEEATPSECLKHTQRSAKSPSCLQTHVKRGIRSENKVSKIQNKELQQIGQQTATKIES